MVDVHFEWKDMSAAYCGALFSTLDFRGRPEVYKEILALPHLTHLAFPSIPYVGKRGIDAGVKPIPARPLEHAGEVDLDFWRRSSGLMLFSLKSQKASIRLNGWDPDPRLYPFDLSTPNRCDLHLGPTKETITGEEMTRSWMRELFSQILSVFPASEAWVDVTHPSDEVMYHPQPFTDHNGWERYTRVSWLTYYDSAVLDHVGRDKVERCSAMVEFDFFGGALLCVAEEPLALHPRELYERTRKVNEELDQIAPPRPGGLFI